MNLPGSIWSDLPLSTGIATLVCYAGVFGDVIGIEEVAARLGVSGQDEFYTALNKLHLQGRLIQKDGYAALPDLEDKVAVKASKKAATDQLIGSSLDSLHKLGRSPLIKFVGISGSLAASNPTRDRYDRLDIDLFLITRNQCLWLSNILRSIRNYFPRSKQRPELCINYVMDESNLLVTNRNFYTATEIRNLIPVSGLDTYRKFLQVNNWVDYYYPGFSGAATPLAVTPSGNQINNAFYVLYTVIRSIKWLSLDPLRNLSFTTDPNRDINAHLIRAHYGGYQGLVQKKFSRLAEAWFPELVDARLIEKLFPDELSAELRRGDIDMAKIFANASLEYDFSKYG